MGEKQSAKCLGQSLKAPAKLNLGLSVVGRRANGYHLLESLFWPIDMCDELDLSPARETSLEVEWAEDSSNEKPRIENNLVSQAWELLQPRQATRIRLLKRIPIGAGLGGGSSDAAVILRAADELDERHRFEKALSLGADVPFFLNPKPAWVTGIGEECRYLELESSLLKDLTFLLVLPQLEIPTRTIFDDYRASTTQYSKGYCGFESGTLRTKSLIEYLGAAKNDLEPVIGRRHPAILEILSKLRRGKSIYTGLSGTGSTCFAVYLENHNTEIKELSHFFRRVGCKSVKVKTFMEA